MSRDLNTVQFEYAQASAKAGEHAFHAENLKKEIEKHEYNIEKLFNQMKTLTAEAQVLANQKAKEQKEATPGTVSEITETLSETTKEVTNDPV